MKIYLSVVAILVIAIFSYGFVVPALVSMRDTFAVLGGLVVAVVIAPSCLWFMAKRTYQQFTNKGNAK